MYRYVFLCITIIALLVSGCTSSSSDTDYNDDVQSYTLENNEMTEPTVTTEIPSTTNEEIFTQEDTSL